MKVSEIFESKTNFAPKQKKDLERMNRARTAKNDATPRDQRPGGGSDVMNHLTSKTRDPKALKTKARKGKKGITGISGKERMKKIKQAVPGEK